MANFTLIYEGGLRTTATHNGSGSKIITDAPVDNHGKGEAFSPTDLVCSSLASCMLTIMGILANRENIDMSGMRMEIDKIMTKEGPRKIQEIKVEVFWAPVKATPEQIEKLKRAALTCPVTLSLHPDIKQNIHFHF